MFSIFKSLIVVGVCLSFFNQSIAFAEVDPGTYDQPEKGKLSSWENEKLWNEYCDGDVGSLSKMPSPNYSNPRVKRAADILSLVNEEYSFYYYKGVAMAYGLYRYNPDPNATEKYLPVMTGVPSGVTHSAHAYLVQLCGEFRDRAAMVEAKVNWVTRFHKLKDEVQSPIDVNKNVWSQVSAKSYTPFLNFSRSLWNSRNTGGKYQFGQYSVDMPVDGLTVCETKYIFSEYISKSQSFPGLAAYDSGYQKFQSQCPSDDLDYYYDFRGDSNLKHYSPESNGMIWYATSIANHCSDLQNAKSKSKAQGVNDSYCSGYFESPFSQRYRAARSGLGAWLFRHNVHDSHVSSSSSSLTVIPHDESEHYPFKYTYPGKSGPPHRLLFWENIPGRWARSDMGFNEAMELSAEAGFNPVQLAYERIRDAVDRHTDWYASGYDDGLGFAKTSAYSPFVASSYDMSASNQFAQPGSTVSAPSDGRKHWMYVFKVKKSNWYNTTSLKNGVSIDFDRHWFDETSFGTTSLAKSERAWDRLGTALEEELETALYLHNLTTSGSPSWDGAPDW